ncbi:MAG: hypothetical protein AAF890_00605 [Pseudomonadota bacterium]
MLRRSSHLPWLACVFGAALTLQGCKLAASDLNAGLNTSGTHASTANVKTVAVKRAALPKPSVVGDDTNMAALKPANLPKPLKVSKQTIDVSGVSDYGKFLDQKATTGSVGQERSARCRQILAEAGLDATMLRSPTLSATLDQDGKGGLSLGYDVLDLRRARMKIELAQLQCDRYEASVRLAQLLVTSTQALSRAGYLAKADYLGRNRAALKRVQRRVVADVDEGLVTVHSANAIRQRISQVIAQEARVRGEAERREVVDNIQVKSARNIDRKLIDYEQRIYKLQKALRTTDAYEVSVSGGYNYDAQDDPFSVDAGNDLYAKVKVGVRLGVFHRDRAAFENELRQSRLDALYQANTGALWRADKMAGANSRVLHNLRLQRNEVASALKEAKRTVIASRNADDPWLVSSGLRSRIDIVALGAELAGLDATIDDVGRLDKKLRFEK